MLLFYLYLWKQQIPFIKKTGVILFVASSVLTPPLCPHASLNSSLLTGCCWEWWTECSLPWRLPPDRSFSSVPRQKTQYFRSNIHSWNLFIAFWNIKIVESSQQPTSRSRRPCWGSPCGCLSASGRCNPTWWGEGKRDSSTPEVFLCTCKCDLGAASHIWKSDVWDLEPLQ